MARIRNGHPKSGRSECSSLSPDSPLIPPFVSRLNTARLFIECEAYEDAIEILEGLEDEDDEEFEVMYLLGLVNWMLGEKDTAADQKREFYIDSREVLERFLLIAQRKPDEVDREMLQQVKEMISTIEKEKGITAKDVEEATSKAEAMKVNGTGHNDEEAWEDEDDDDEEMS